MVTIPSKLCVDDRCVNIDHSHWNWRPPKGLSKEFEAKFEKAKENYWGGLNRVDDDVFCYSVEGSCRLGKDVYKADAQEDSERLKILREIIRYFPENAHRIVYPYARFLRLSGGYKYFQICLGNKAECSKMTQIPVGFHQAWATRMKRHFGVDRVHPAFFEKAEIFSEFGGSASSLVSFVDRQVPMTGQTFGVECVVHHRWPEPPGKDYDFKVEIHELTHAYLHFHSSRVSETVRDELAPPPHGLYLPDWLGEMLAFYIQLDGNLAEVRFLRPQETEEEFIDFMAKHPLQFLETDFLEGLEFQESIQFERIVGNHQLAFVVGRALLEINPNSIELLGREFFSTDFSKLKPVERKGVWIRILQEKCGISHKQLLSKVLEALETRARELAESLSNSKDKRR